MHISEQLHIRTGITTVIGSGGKTSLLRKLALALPGKVILCTTTRILPFSEFHLITSADENLLCETLCQNRIVCVGSPEPDGKLSASRIPFLSLLSLADYILVEADGSKSLPLKAHAAHEPVIPPGSNQTICVVGATGFGKPIDIAVHRPEIFAKLTGAPLQSPATPQLAAKAILLEGFADRIFINQVDTPSELEAAKAFILACDGALPVTIGSLQCNKTYL